MKQLIIALLIFSGVSFAQVARSARDSITTLQQTDIMSWQTLVTGAHKGRQMSWRLLSGEISDYMDGLTLTWANIQTYNGANFSAGSHGTVTTADSLLVQGNLFMASNIFPTTNYSRAIGSNTRRFAFVIAQRMWAEGFYILDPDGADSSDAALITYDGNTIDFGAVKLTADTISGLTTTSWYENIHSVSDVNDSSLTVNYGNNVIFLLPGANMTNLEAITMDDIPAGSIVHQVTFWIIDSQDYNITFIDVDTAGGHTSDRNMQLAGDFDMDAGDSITLEWRPSQSATSGGDWQEVSRSNNR